MQSHDLAAALDALVVQDPDSNLSLVQLRHVLRSLGLRPAARDLRLALLSRGGVEARPFQKRDTQGRYTQPCPRVWQGLRLQGGAIQRSSALGRYFAATDWGQHPPEARQVVELKVSSGATVAQIASTLRLDPLVVKVLLQTHQTLAEGS